MIKEANEKSAKELASKKANANLTAEEMESKRTQLQLQIAALKQEQSAVKQQQNDLNIESMEGVNKLVAKEMIVNQDSHFKNEINKLESMVANNDF